MVAYSDGDGDGDFKGWLKKLGISDTFTRTYPLVRLAQWGWLKPQYRLVFPAAYFVDDTTEAEVMPTTAPIKNSPFDELVANQWPRDGEDEPMWFIHPFFRPQTDVGRMLRQNSANTGLPEVPELSISPAVALLQAMQTTTFHGRASHFWMSSDMLIVFVTTCWTPQTSKRRSTLWRAWRSHRPETHTNIWSWKISGEDLQMS